MSGEVIIITETFSLVTAVQDSINEYIEQRRLDVENAIKKRKQKIDQWQSFQERQQRNIQDIEASQIQLREKLSQFKLMESAPRESSNTSVQARGFVTKTEDFQEQIIELNALIENAQELPESLLAAQSPIARLILQAKDYVQQYQSNFPPTENTMLSFKQALELTIEQQLSELQEQQKLNTELLFESEQILGQVIEYQVLASSFYERSDSTESPKTLSPNLSPTLSPMSNQPMLETRVKAKIADLNTIEQHLLKVLERRTIKLSDIRLLKNKVAQIKEKIDEYIGQEMNYRGISESIHTHLTEFGYQQIESESLPHQGQSQWLIPGGEQLELHLHQDMRIAFQLQHEPSNNEQSALGGDELAFLRQQEKKWCDHLPQLLQKLAEDGFQYEVEFRRDTPVESIPIVVVDELDDLVSEADQQQGANNKKTRYLP